MKKLLFLTLLSVSFTARATTLHIESQNASNKNILLCYFLGEKTYIQDTISLNANGNATYSNTELHNGIYLLVLPDRNNASSEFIIYNEPEFTISFEFEDLENGMSFTNSPQNKALYEYKAKNKRITDQNQELQKALSSTTDDAKKQSLVEEIATLKAQYYSMLENHIEKYPGLFHTQLLLLMKGPDIPEHIKSQGKDAEYNYFIEHYWDAMDWTDEAFVHTNIYHSKLMDYVNKFTIQDIPHITGACDFVLEKSSANDQLFKHNLYWLFNYFSEDSRSIGVSIYVHLAMNYYATGKAVWAEEEQVKKIVANAQKSKIYAPGYTIPKFKLMKGEKPVHLHALLKEGTNVLMIIDNKEANKPQYTEVIEELNTVSERVPYFNRIAVLLNDKNTERGEMWNEWQTAHYADNLHDPGLDDVNFHQGFMLILLDENGKVETSRNNPLQIEAFMEEQMEDIEE